MATATWQSNRECCAYVDGAIAGIVTKES